MADPARHSTPRSQAERAKGYVSEFEQFLGEFMHRHPEVEASQREGWRQFWERDVDFEEWKEQASDRVPRRGYEYF